MRLDWDHWFRSSGAREHMPSVVYHGVNFGTLFWEAMRLVFLDEHDRPGVLYTGQVYQHAQQVIAENANRYTFFVEDEEKMLKYGQFKYAEITGTGPHRHFNPTLRIEGPDLPEDTQKQRWAKANRPGFLVEFNFYYLTDWVRTKFGGETDDGLSFLRWMTGAIMLHEIMHNHGYTHPEDVSWTTGADYASSLPHVAFWSVMRCSPHGKWVDDIATGGLSLTGENISREAM